MKNILVLVIFLCIGISSYAQNAQERIYITNNQNTILILNNEVVGNVDLLKIIPSEKIKELKIDKKRLLSNNRNLYFDGESSGMILAKTNYTVKTKKQEELNHFFGLASDTNLYVNGFLLEDKNLRIASKSILKIEIVDRGEQFPGRPVLNISIY